MKPLRILTLSNCPLVEDQGSGYVILCYAKGLRALGHEVDLWGPDDYILFKKIKAVERLRLLLGYALKVIRATCVRRYDVIELWGSEGWLSLIFIRMLNLQQGGVVIARANGIEPHYAEKSRFAYDPAGRKILTRLMHRVQVIDWSYRFSDGLTVVSHFDASYAVREKYRPAHGMLVLPNPLKSDWLGMPQTPRNPERIGFVGKWLENKGTAVLVLAIPLILNSIPDATVWLAGIEAGDEATQSLKVKYGDRLMIYPRIPKEKLKQLYLKTSLLISASYYESFGLAIAEAMACGVAVVATKTGYAWELVDGVDCLHINFGDHMDVAEKVQCLWDDRALLENIQKNGQKRVQALRWSENLERLGAYYQKLATSSKLIAQTSHI